MSPAPLHTTNSPAGSTPIKKGSTLLKKPAKEKVRGIREKQKPIAKRDALKKQAQNPRIHPQAQGNQENPSETPAPTTWWNVPLTLNAPYALVYDLSSHTVLLDQRMHAQFTPSSMTKIATAMIAFKAIKEGRLALTDTMEVSTKAWRTEGSRMFLSPKDSPDVDSLLRGILVISGNDACVTLAEGMCGSEETFASQMTELAKEAGAQATNFVNSTGLYDPQHYSTCWDLMLLSRATIEKFPDFYKTYYAIPTFTYGGITQPNLNPLLTSGIADGLKTGHTDHGGYGLAASCQKDGRRIIIVINGLPTMKARKSEAKKLSDWAFGCYRNIEITHASMAIPVKGGKQKTVRLLCNPTNILTIPTSVKGNTIHVRPNLPSFILAPLVEGQPVGTITVNIPGKGDSTFSLTAAENVERSFVLLYWIECLFAWIEKKLSNS